MSAKILKFPVRAPFAVRVEREIDGEAWLVRTHDREWGWLNGDFNAALRDARGLARDFSVGIQSSAGRFAP
jgi:hypothetical protein